MFDDTRTLQQACLIGLTLEDTLVGALYDITQILLQLHHLTCAIDDINAIIVIKEQRAIVEMTHARDNGPRSFSLWSREDISIAHRTLLVGSQQSIEPAVMIFQRGGPLSTSVHRTFQQVILGGVGQLIEDIAHGLPVLQILRGHNRCARHQVHRG